MPDFTLPPSKPDPILQVMARYREDPRPEKIDLGVGVYRDAHGATPVMRAIKEAEHQLFKTEDTKSYQAIAGDAVFVEKMKGLVLGEGVGPVAAVQTVGGTGAVREAFELYLAAHPGGRIHVGLPSWPNHFALAAAVGLPVETYDYYDAASKKVQFENLTAALEGASPGDAVLFHGSCHNPTGADLSADQWADVISLVRDKDLIPVIDCAYYGLGDGLDADLSGAQQMLATVPVGMLAASCSKNFGLYRERTGAVFVRAAEDMVRERAQGMLQTISRRTFSMPPAHGALLVRTVLESGELTAKWKEELEEMRLRVANLRAALAGVGGNAGLEGLTGQRGMFSVLNLTPAQIERLAVEQAVYMTTDGRINIAGCREDQIPRLVEALQAVA